MIIYNIMSIETPSEILPSHNLKSLFKNLLSQQLLLEGQLEPQDTQNIIHTQEIEEQQQNINLEIQTQEIEEQQQNINLEIHTQEQQESGKGSGNTVSYRQGGKGGGSQQQNIYYLQILIQLKYHL